MLLFKHQWDVHVVLHSPAVIPDFVGQTQMQLTWIEQFMYRAILLPTAWYILFCVVSFLYVINIAVFFLLEYGSPCVCSFQL